MPILQVNMSDPADVQAALDVLMRHQGTVISASAQDVAPAPRRQSLVEAMAELKQQAIWRFLYRIATLEVPEFSLPELARHLKLPTNKVGSLKAILGKPEQRLGIQFF